MLALLFPILVDICGGGVCAIIIISAACVCVCMVNSIPHAGFVSWTQECGCSTLQHESCTVNFTELSRALMILYSNRSEWSEDDIISVIDEMTSKCIMF